MQWYMKFKMSLNILFWIIKCGTESLCGTYCIIEVGSIKKQSFHEIHATFTTIKRQTISLKTVIHDWSRETNTRAHSEREMGENQSHNKWAQAMQYHSRKWKITVKIIYYNNIRSGYSQVKSSFLKVVCNFFMSFNTFNDTSLALEGRTWTTPAERPRVFIVVVTSTSPFWWQ